MKIYLTLLALVCTSLPFSALAERPTMVAVTHSGPPANVQPNSNLGGSFGTPTSGFGTRPSETDIGYQAPTRQPTKHYVPDANEEGVSQSSEPDTAVDTLEALQDTSEPIDDIDFEDLYYQSPPETAAGSSVETVESSEPTELEKPIVVERPKAALYLSAGQVEEARESVVKTEADLTRLVQAAVQSNKNLSKITVQQDTISFHVNDTAKVLGFIPVDYVLPLTLETDGNVIVARPWWLFLATDQASDLELALEADDDLQVIEQNQAVITNIYQRLGAFLRAAEQVISESL